MNANKILVVIATVLAVGLPSLALAVEIGDVGIGKEFAAKNCAECHAIEGKNAISPNPDAPSFSAVSAMPSTTRMALEVWMKSTHPTMPNLILSAEETDNVVAYILSLNN